MPSETSIRRCIDYVAYFPDQRIPQSACGYMRCGGEYLGTMELAADSDFSRTFGAASATCTTDEEVRNRNIDCFSLVGF